jgi:hypothetical protein
MNTLLHARPGERVTDKVRRAAFWILVFVALGAITVGVTAWQGRSDVPDVTGHAGSSVTAAATIEP